MNDNVIILLYVFILSIPIAVVGVVYSYVLTREGQIFEKPYTYAINYLPAWLHQPLIGCHLCVTGQLALWLFIFVICPVIGVKYNFFLHVYFICQSIYFAQAVKFVYLKIEHENG